MYQQYQQSYLQYCNTEVFKAIYIIFMIKYLNVNQRAFVFILSEHNTYNIQQKCNHHVKKAKLISFFCGLLTKNLPLFKVISYQLSLASPLKKVDHIILKVVIKAKIPYATFFKSRSRKYFLSIVFCQNELTLLRFRTNQKTGSLMTSPWVLRNCDGLFKIFL